MGACAGPLRSAAAVGVDARREPTANVASENDLTGGGEFGLNGDEV